MIKDLNPEQALLANFMSDISERCYYAGWFADLEYVLWDAVINGERRFGQDIITNEDVRILTELSGKNNCWIIFDDNTEETAIELSEWKKKFQDFIEQNSNPLKNY